MDAASSPVQITLNILKISGAKVMSASFAADENVAAVKKAIQRTTGTPEADQKLLWESQELMKTVKLEHYNFDESSDVVLVVMNPLARWAKILLDSTGNDFRSQLRRRDAVCKLKDIVAETHVQPDPEAVQCLLNAFKRRCTADSDVESQGMYFAALTAAAKDTGNVDAVEFLMDFCGDMQERPFRRDTAVDALCQVLGRTTPTPAVIERLEHLAAAGCIKARRFLSEHKRGAQTSSLQR